MEGTPAEIDLAAVTKEITGTERVTSMHDLHVWALSSDEVALSCHAVGGDHPLADVEHMVGDREGRRWERVAMGHTPVQVESWHPCGAIHPGQCDHTTRRA